MWRITLCSCHSGTKMAIRFRGAQASSASVGAGIRRRPNWAVINHRHRQARSRNRSSRPLSRTQIAKSTSMGGYLLVPGARKILICDNVAMHSRDKRWLVGSAVVLLFAGVIGLRALVEPKNDFRFSIVGDRTGAAMPEIYGRIWREIDLMHPDFVINVGDTIEGGNDDLADGQWQDLRPVWQRYGHFPLYFTPGNHDIWSQKSLDLYKKETGRPNYYSFNYQDAHFTVLDNSRSLDLTDTQLKFLESDLKANQDRSPKFVFFHKPYWIAFLKVGSGEFALHQLAKKYGVSYVISGHGHQF